MAQRDDDQGARTTLRDYLRILRRRWRIASFVLVLTLVLAAAYSLHQAPRYVAQADVLVQPTTSDLQANGVAAITAEEVATQVRVATSQPVARLVQKKLPAVPLDLENSVTAQPIGSSRIIRITASAPNELRATRLASAVADSYISYRETEAQASVDKAVAGLQAQRTAAMKRIADIEKLLPSKPSNQVSLETERRDLQSKVQLLGAQVSALSPLQSSSGVAGQVLQTGLVAGSSNTKSMILTGLLALIVGLFFAVVAAVVRDRLDGVVRDEESLEGSLAAAPVAGVVRRFPKSVPHGSLVHVAAPLSDANRDINALAINVRHLAGRTAAARPSAALVMVTSPSASPASSSQLVENLAASAAQQGLLVVEIDANPDSSTQDPDAKGLFDVLGGDLEPGAYLVETGIDNLTRLPAGQATARTVNLFSGPRLQHVMNELGKGADLVVLNVPVEAALSSLHLMSDVDVCLVVARAGHTRRSEVTRLVESLRAFGASCVAGALTDAHGHPHFAGKEQTRILRLRH